MLLFRHRPPLSQTKSSNRSPGLVRQANREEGQSLVELGIGVPFLVILVIALIEMGIVFSVYISLINAAREGAEFASKYPQITDANHANDSYNPDGASSCTPSCPTITEEFYSRVTNEITDPTEPLKGQEGQRLIEDGNMDPPTAVVGPNGITPGSPITVTVVYSLQTFTSRVSLPFFGRFGLPAVYRMQYTFSMPIR
ncbi:MAG TPA: TadE/TadG family type IV pilus assembly protein [Anaerolineae bacterium]|nr:TadE/TadG family type IV pilus assembly protein [Anaerolineae bacterium]